MAAAASRALMALAIAATMVVELAMAANYTVADSAGWEISSNFQSWAASKKFTVGDVLLFKYSEGHDVLEVNEPDFSSCSATNPIETHTDGSTAITLLASGKRFFICGVPGHCSAGMKVEINTLATSSPPPSSLDTPPAPPPKVTPSSPPPSSSPAAPTSPPAAPTSPPAVPTSPPAAPTSPPTAPTSPPTAPTSPPASPPKAATKPPAKSPLAPPPGTKASPPAPPAEPTPPSQAPTPEPPIPPFPFNQPIIPSAAPTTPPPPHSLAYKCTFTVHLSVGFSFVVLMLLSL